MTSSNDGWYDQRIDAAVLAWATGRVKIIDRHLSPFTATDDGRIPFHDELIDWLARGNLTEWTVDSMGARDWKIDGMLGGGLLVRYRGSDPAGYRAADACNTELKTT